jgi:hypothetical protein
MVEWTDAAASDGSRYRPRVGFYPLFYMSLRGVVHQTTRRANSSITRGLDLLEKT